LTGENKRTCRETCPSVPLPTAITHAHTQTHTQAEDQNLAVDVKGRRLTALAMAQHLYKYEKNVQALFYLTLPDFRKSTALCNTESRQETAQ